MTDLDIVGDEFLHSIDLSSLTCALRAPNLRSSIMHPRRSVRVHPWVTAASLLARKAGPVPVAGRSIFGELNIETNINLDGITLQSLVDAWDVHIANNDNLLDVILEVHHTAPLVFTYLLSSVAHAACLCDHGPCDDQRHQK